MIAVYTVLLNDYDILNPIKNEKGLEYFVFTDDKDLKVEGWKNIIVEKGDVKKQREIKLLPHKYLPEYKTTIYLDANMRVKTSLLGILNRFKGGILKVKHPNRRCVYKEAQAVLKQGKAKRSDVNEQIKYYKELRFPVNFGMWASGFMIRENCKDVNEFSEIWNEQVQKFTHRDQLSVGYAFWKTGLKPREIHWQELVRNIEINKHKPKPLDNIKVYYSTPFRSDKNIGKANNEFIELLPEDAWVCITDGDALFFQPDFGKQIEDIIKENGDKFGLIGCVTNRLNGLHQLHNNEFSEDMNARNHYEISNELREKNGSLVEETTGVAGVCMIFSKRVWKEVGGFKEKTYSADTYFNKSVRRKGYKIGIAKGLYMFHCYRILKKEHKEAAASIKHLV